MVSFTMTVGNRNRWNLCLFPSDRQVMKNYCRHLKIFIRRRSANRSSPPGLEFLVSRGGGGGGGRGILIFGKFFTEMVERVKDEVTRTGKDLKNARYFNLKIHRPCLDR